MIVITSLEERKLRGDMIEVYKVLTGKEQIDHRQFFNSADTIWPQRTREETGKGQIEIRFNKEWSMDGTIFRQKSSIRNQLPASRTHTTATTAKIWTTEADHLPVHQPTSTSTSTISLSRESNDWPITFSFLSRLRLSVLCELFCFHYFRRSKSS